MKNFFTLNFNISKKYKKFGLVYAKKATLGAQILTVIDNIIETKNIAKENDVLIKGIKGELYLIDINKFKERYNVTSDISDEFKPFEPFGECFAFEYKGDELYFDAPWGEKMLLSKGDYLVTPNEKIPEVYRIERSAFNLTYKII
jgi:hypothetical protein